LDCRCINKVDVKSSDGSVPVLLFLEKNGTSAQSFLLNLISDIQVYSADCKQKFRVSRVIMTKIYFIWHRVTVPHSLSKCTFTKQGSTENVEVLTRQIRGAWLILLKLEAG
jgi:hypothetical protein